jgi:Fic family protein
MRMAETELKTRPFNLNLLKKLHYILLTGVRGRNKARGEFRTTQNLIGLPGATLETAEFVPPEPQLLPEYLDNWEKYWHLDRPDPLVQLAIIHAQFEMIHPFLDGNGRVGRMLIPLFLLEKGLLENPVFYISSYLDDNRDIYYAKLNNISQNADWDGWLSFFLEAVETQAKTNTDSVQSILNLYGEMKDKIIGYTKSPFAIRALDAIFERPLFTTTNFIKGSSIPKPSALRMLSKLKEEKALVTIREGKGRQPELLAFEKLMDLINS